MKLHRSILSMAAMWTLAACSSGNTSANANGDVGGTASAIPKLTDVNVRDYELDMDKVRKWLSGMDALMAAAKTDSSVAAAVASNGNETTQQTIAKLEGNAAARDILNKAGVSPRDYVMTMTAYLQAALADAAQRAVPPGKGPSDVNPKNVDFIRQNRGELEPLLKNVGLAS